MMNTKPTCICKHGVFLCNLFDCSISVREFAAWKCDLISRLPLQTATDHTYAQAHMHAPTYTSTTDAEAHKSMAVKTKW